MTSNIPKGPGCLAGVRVPRAHPGLTRQATSCDAILDLKLTLSGSIIYDVINILQDACVSFDQASGAACGRLKMWNPNPMLNHSFI